MLAKMLKLMFFIVISHEISSWKMSTIKKKQKNVPSKDEFVVTNPSQEQLLSLNIGTLLRVRFWFCIFQNCLNNGIMDIQWIEFSKSSSFPFRSKKMKKLRKCFIKYKILQFFQKFPTFGKFPTFLIQCKCMQSTFPIANIYDSNHFFWRYFSLEK